MSERDVSSVTRVTAITARLVAITARLVAKFSRAYYIIRWTRWWKGENHCCQPRHFDYEGEKRVTFLKKVAEKFVGMKKMYYLCTRNRERCSFRWKERRCGNSSVGRARPCQGRGRGSESRFPLNMLKKSTSSEGLQWKCPGGGIGRRARFRCVCREACRFESCSGHSFFFTSLNMMERWRNW